MEPDSIKLDVYKIVDGDLYTSKDGEWIFLENLYDFNFRENKYVEENGIVYLKDPNSNDRYEVSRTFESNFDVNSVDDLLSLDGFSSYNADPKKAGESHNFYNDGSRMSIVDHLGRRSLGCYAKANDDVVKSSIYKRNMYYESGDHIYFSFYVFIEDTADFGSGFTIFDIESELFKSSPGIRLIFRGRNLSYELKWINRMKYNQEQGKEVEFPTGQWVKIRGSVFLSALNDGIVELWQDDVKVISDIGQTLVLSDVVYDRVEVGVSALSGSNSDKTLYVSEFKISNTVV